MDETSGKRNAKIDPLIRDLGISEIQDPELAKAVETLAYVYRHTARSLIRYKMLYRAWRKHSKRLGKNLKSAQKDVLFLEDFASELLMTDSKCCGNCKTHPA